MNSPKSPEDYINHSLYFEAKTFLHGLLIVEDKLGMAHGIEVRLPFLDNDIVNFAMKCPVKMKLNNLNKYLRFNENEIGGKVEKYFQRTGDKKIFRDVMKKYLLKEVAKREKQGFSSPDASWFRGESIDFVKKLVLNRNSRIYDFF
jgi:asparagine synthase (glutamine-hydrolysing)